MEVLALVGPAIVARARKEITEFTCAVCAGPGDVRRAPANLVAHRDPRGLVAVKLAHPGCSASVVLDAMIGFGSAADAGTDVDSHAILFPGGHSEADLACLVIDTSSSITRAFPSGDIDDFLTGGLLGRGWTLVATLDQSMPVLDDVVVDLSIQAGRVTMLDGGSSVTVLDRLPDVVPPRWREVAAQRGLILVLAGRAGGAPMSLNKLAQACRAGAIVGCAAQVMTH